MQETLNCKTHGDTAFRAKDFATAIARYTKVSLCPIEVIKIIKSYIAKT